MWGPFEIWGHHPPQLCCMLPQPPPTCAYWNLHPALPCRCFSPSVEEGSARQLCEVCCASACSNPDSAEAAHAAITLPAMQALQQCPGMKDLDIAITCSREGHDISGELDWATIRHAAPVGMQDHGASDCQGPILLRGIFRNIGCCVYPDYSGQCPQPLCLCIPGSLLRAATYPSATCIQRCCLLTC